MDLRSFGRRMRVVAQDVVDGTSVIVRKCALAVDAAVVLGTPVDTGRARSNWQVELDQPAQGTIDAYAPGKEGSTKGPNAQAAIAQGQQVVAAYKPGQVIHITNNLAYIGRLNEGHSAQAPAGFVEAAVLAGVAQIRGARILVKGDRRVLGEFNGGSA